MRLSILLTVLGCLALGVSCTRSDPAAPAGQTATRLSNFNTGSVVVYVHWGSQGIAGIQVDIVELNRSTKTDTRGIAVFRVPAGGYTVRVHDINLGGPSLRWIDTKAVVAPGEETRIDIVDCLPCV
ncbi:MAG TPA: hypothetical protein VFH88_01750 [Candidatus Krumholzibacteria bacterium]|nr:hypothetical protein [Candidatus Krumholzibacteria bacterium]